MPSSPDRRLQLVIDQETQEQIKALAKTHERTLSAEIRTAIRAWIKQHQADRPMVTTMATEIPPAQG